MLIFTITDEQLADARAAIARNDGTRVRTLFAAFGKTREIYLGQNTNPYESNGAQARLMKRTLLGYRNGTPPKARVLFKFGDAHMRNGINGLVSARPWQFRCRTRDGEGADSLHLLVVGARGTHALYNGVGRQVRLEPFVITDHADFTWLKDALPTKEGKKNWILLGLRSLRWKSHRDVPAAWQRVIEGFDMIIVAPAITPSSLLGRISAIGRHLAAPREVENVDARRSYPITVAALRPPP